MAKDCDTSKQWLSSIGSLAPTHSVLSVDVEDWFHILDLDCGPSFDQWSRQESRVEKNFGDLLDLFDEYSTKVTCFFLGWIAEKYPDLVREAHSRGHEISSHGYAHQLVSSQSQSDFASDICKSKAILEDIVGDEVLGYRAPGFSITGETHWAFDEIRKAGFRYDASIFPGNHGHGGIPSADLHPFVVPTNHGQLLEFPVSVLNTAGQRLCMFGGGYFRLFPYPLIRSAANRIAKSNRMVFYYLHPRDLDTDQPRLDMNLVRRFKSYVNLGTTRGKLVRLLEEKRFVRFKDLRSSTE